MPLLSQDKPSEHYPLEILIIAVANAEEITYPYRTFGQNTKLHTVLWHATPFYGNRIDYFELTADFTVKDLSIVADLSPIYITGNTLLLTWEVQFQRF